MEDVRSQLRGGLIDGWCLQLESGNGLLPGLPDDVALNCLARASRSDYDSLSCVNKRFHKLITSGDLYKLRKQLGIVEHWVYLSCAFDPDTNKWMSLPKIPSEIGISNEYKHTLAVDSELLVLGHDTHDRFVIWKYSWIHRGWVKCEGMNRPRVLFGSGSFGSIAIVAGGVDENRNVLNSAELYDSTTGTWETLPNMHSARSLCSGFFVDEKFYVIGGLSSPLDPALTSGEEYDFKTRKWRMIEEMYPYVDGYLWTPPIVAVIGNQLYSVERRHNMVRTYNKAKNTWDVLGRLPDDFWFTGGLDFTACGGELLVVTEQRGPEGKSVVLYSWCPKSRLDNGTLDWKVLGTMKHVSVLSNNCAVMGC